MYDEPSRRKNIILSNCQSAYRVAVVKWNSDDGIAEVIHNELCALGHYPTCFLHNETIPSGSDVVFSYGPYGMFLPLARRVAAIPAASRPTFVHWNTEGIPDPRLPWRLMRLLGTVRSWIGRLPYIDQTYRRAMAIRPLINWERTRMLRFRYLGDYYYAYQKGWLDVFADSSAIYARLHNQQGLPTIFAPWGATPGWYKNLRLERDIDVLWMGNRGSRRRSDLLSRLCQELYVNGVNVYVADNVEKSFIFGEERIHFLNRAKITLNLTRTWYDDNFSRFAMAASNRSLIVSEPLLSHCPQCEAGVHYATAPIETLAKTILYYLTHNEERLSIVENAYQLVTTELRFRNSVNAIMDAVNKSRQTPT